jgi:hypothetical protein
MMVVPRQSVVVFGMIVIDVIVTVQRGRLADRDNQSQ